MSMVTEILIREESQGEEPGPGAGVLRGGATVRGGATARFLKYLGFSGQGGAVL